MGTRTGTFCKDDKDSEEVAGLFDAFRMLDLVTEWRGKISGISYKSGFCDGCVKFQLCRSVLFLGLVGQMPVVIWEGWTAVCGR